MLNGTIGHPARTFNSCMLHMYGPRGQTTGSWCGICVLVVKEMEWMRANELNMTCDIAVRIRICNDAYSRHNVFAAWCCAMK